MNQADGSNDLVLSALSLRRIIGWLGFSLPVICILCSLASWTPILESISAYYFSRIHGFFVGILCALGVSLFCYKGYDKIERGLAAFGGLFAVGVALCPTARPNGKDAKTVVDMLIGPWFDWLAYAHTTFAALLFLVFMIFASALFTRGYGSDENDPLTFKSIALALFHTMIRQRRNPKDLIQDKEKEKRNILFRACGRIIGVSILLIAIFSGLHALHVIENLPIAQWVFVWEMVAIWAFGVSWLIKASSLSPDSGQSVSLDMRPSAK